MNTPRTCVPYVLYQRTEYIASNNVRGIRKIPYKWRVHAESLLRRDSIAHSYWDDMAKEMGELQPHLGKTNSILDIGAGMGGIDVLLNNELHPQTITLLDKEAVESRIWYGFNASGAAYNSFSASLELLRANGVDCDLWTVNADTDPFPAGPFDLVVSLLSWGFHYPVSVYLEQVYSAMTGGGRLILDVRHGTDGLDKLRARFGQVKILKNAEKHDRVLCIKK